MHNDLDRKQKVLYILLAMLVSATIWFYADEFSNNGGAQLIQKTLTDVPITYTGEDDLGEHGLMLLDDQTSASVDLTIKAPRRTIAFLDRNDVRVMANLSEIEKSGVQAVDYQILFLDNRFTRNMVAKESIDHAVVNISELNSKTVDIRCELVGNVAEGYSAGELQLSQDTLEILGQAVDIDPISYVKVVFDIGNNVTETISQALEFQYYTEDDKLLTGTGLHPKVDTVQATLPVYVTKELHLTVDFQEHPGARIKNLNYKIKPETILVSGEASVLNEMDTIVLGKIDLLDLLGTDSYRKTYPIMIPEGCQNLSGVTRAEMDVGFEDMAFSEVTTDHFTYKNLPDGKRVDILTQEVTVRLFGPAEKVKAVRGKDVSVVANLSNYSEASGTYSVPAVIELKSSHDIGVSGTYAVQVTIQDADELPPDEILDETPDENQNETGQNPSQE